MEWIAVLVICGLVFGLCFLADKGFTKLFRSKAQHKSGLAVKLNKRTAIFGLGLVVIGIAAMVNFGGGGWLLLIGGAFLLLLGIGLLVYYLSFGIFYDGESFVYTAFGKRSRTYRYAEIQSQQLFNSSGNIVFELYMSDGETVQLAANMDGTYAFLDHAFAAWLVQTGRKKEDCPFYDPDNSRWFPSDEE